MKVLVSLLLLWGVTVLAQEEDRISPLIPVPLDLKGKKGSSKCKKRMKGRCRDEDVDPPACTDVATSFEHEVLVEYVGIPDLVTPFEIMVLEQAFLETYNGFTNTSCAGLSFRTVEQVEITTDPLADNGMMMRRALQAGNNTGVNVTRAMLLRPFVYRLFIRGRCRGCRNDRLFFDEGFVLRVRSLQEGEEEGGDSVLSGGSYPYDKGSRRGGGAKSKKTSKMKKSKKDGGGDTEEACPECIPPTAANFTVAYSMTIQALAANGTLQNVDRVNNVAELENVTCDTNVTFFETDVFVDFVGDPNQSSPPEIAALEQGFLETYNALNVFDSTNCDLLFREVEQVEIVDTAAEFNRRALQGMTTNATNATLPPAIVLRPFVFLFRIRGRCRGCRRDANLFDEGISLRRGLQQLDEAHMDGTGALSIRHLQQEQPADCVCAIGADDFRAPTREEFTAAFNSTVQFLVLEGEVDFVEEVVETAEVEPLVCPAPSEFETEVFLDFFGNPDVTTSFEELALENGFVSTYNFLAETYCDPLFRTVLEAEIVGVGENEGLPPALRQLQGGGVVNDTAPPLAPNATVFRPFRFLFRVRGRCRGCRRDANLFDDGIRLRSNSGGRRLEGSVSDTCFCDTNPVDFRAPSEQEFETEYNNTVIALELPNVAAVLNVDEPNPTTSPSIAPAMAPSDMPSMKPSLPPVTPSPVTPSPVTPSPVTPSPVTPSPVTPSPVTPSPVTPSPVTPSPVTPSPVTPSPTTAAPSVTQVADPAALDFPYSLADLVFGGFTPRDRLPLYFLDSAGWNETEDVFEAFRFSDESSVTVSIESVGATWETLQATNNITFTGDDLEFVLSNNIRATVVIGFLFGQNATVGDFGGIVVSTNVDAILIPFFNLSAIPLLPQVESNALEAPRSKGRNLEEGEELGREGGAAKKAEKGKEQTQEDIMANWERIGSWLEQASSSSQRRLQAFLNITTCDGFLSEVGSSLVCSEDDFFVANSTCTADAAFIYEVASASILSPVVDFQNEFQVRITLWLYKRAADMAVGYVGCLMNPFRLLTECMSEVHRSATVVAVEDLNQIVADLLVLQLSVEAFASAQFTGLCESVRSLAEECFSCELCSVEFPGVDCCSNEDCVNLQGLCISNTCVTDGNPRFTLTWTGDDDLDVHVITPFGFEIYWDNTTDPFTAGRLDQDDIPEVVGTYVENILFPSPSEGTYSYFVDLWAQVGTPDEWLLQVFVNGIEVANHTGVGSSDLFTVSPLSP